MQFRITLHSGYSPPADAIETLWTQLASARTEDVSFAKVGGEIRATWGHGEGSRATRDERVEAERRAVFEIVCEICERDALLKSDWFAVGPLG
jgi:hypothetical protein